MNEKNLSKTIDNISKFLQARMRLRLVSANNENLKSELEIVFCSERAKIHFEIGQKILTADRVKNDIKRVPEVESLLVGLDYIIDRGLICFDEVHRLRKCIEVNYPEQNSWCTKSRKLKSDVFAVDIADGDYLRNRMPRESSEIDFTYPGFEDQNGTGFVIHDLLGVYYGYTNRRKGVIVILMDEIEKAAFNVCDVDDLVNVVLVHEMAHAYHHLGIDEVDSINDTFYKMSRLVVEGVANYMVSRYIEEAKGKSALRKAFEQCTVQTGAYGVYKWFESQRYSLRDFTSTDIYFRSLAKRGLLKRVHLVDFDEKLNSTANP